MVVGSKADFLGALGLGGVPSVGVFLRDPNGNSGTTPNGQVDKRDRGLNLALPVYQFLSVEPLSH